MTSLEKQFQAALRFTKEGPPDLQKKTPTDEQRLRLYAYFKQITVGPCKKRAPPRLNFVARAKWDGWKKLGDLSKEEAMKKYIQTLEEFAPKWKDWKEIKAAL
eukprot:TRINITY_DN41907_c0_g1_i1.p1 TRINITY_DN41907_c0_g1~~TRINITY_DN41907_c0_g1_i1.p1  ORF type:complete len:118 (-),score=9.63 TRINITY_DN41907_c0_g1_i1:85-393(-)